ncbi:MAG: hypothetical protein OXF11_21580 [Deltaproteobacteria bacterium]|nr:hypothetical protein [Deltaproteobacteria bacterium]
MSLIVSAEQTRELVDMTQCIRLLDRMFRDRAAGKVRTLPRRRLQGSSKQLNIMAAWHQDTDLIALRSYVAKANTISLYDGAAGALQVIMSAAYLSSLRTGAATGVAAKYLAPPKPAVLGLIGPGWQGTFQVEAVVKACRPKQVLVYGRNAARRQSFIETMRKVVKTPFRVAGSLDEVESESDILVISTSSTTPIVDGRRLKDDVLVATIGANSTVKHEVSGRLVRSMDLVVTDDLATARHCSGDLVDACARRQLRWRDVVPLETIVSDGVPGRARKVLFQSNGIPDEDLAVGTYVLRQALRKKMRLREIKEF